MSPHRQQPFDFLALCYGCGEGKSDCSTELLVKISGIKISLIEQLQPKMFDLFWWYQSKLTLNIRLFLKIRCLIYNGHFASLLLNYNIAIGGDGTSRRFAL